MLKNTGQEPPKGGIVSAEGQASGASRGLARAGNATPIDLQVDALQGKLEKAEDARKEERFLWFVFSGALFLVLTFMAAGDVAGGVVSLLYVAMVLVLSRRWGFEDLWETMYAARSLLSKDKEK